MFVFMFYTVPKDDFLYIYTLCAVQRSYLYVVYSSKMLLFVIMMSKDFILILDPDFYMFDAVLF